MWDVRVVFGIPWWVSLVLLIIVVAAVGWFLHLPTHHHLHAALAAVAVFSQSLAQTDYRAKRSRISNGANKAIDRATDASPQATGRTMIEKSSPAMVAIVGISSLSGEVRPNAAAAYVCSGDEGRGAVTWSTKGRRPDHRRSEVA